MYRLIPLALAAAAAAATAGGCLVVSGSSTYESGVKISGPTLSQIEVGKTTEAWLIATLGEPTGRQKVEGRENVEIIHYAHRREETSGGVVLFLFAGGKEETYRSVTYFEIADGVVTRYWTEG